MNIIIARSTLKIALDSLVINENYTNFSGQRTLAQATRGPNVICNTDRYRQESTELNPVNVIVCLPLKNYYGTTLPPPYFATSINCATIFMYTYG